MAAVADANLPGRAYGLSLDQAVAVEKIATSGRVLDVLVGPAGTGKSTTMAGLRAAWEAEHGPGSVVGLAPSAAAAEVLAQELGIATENTAKWLTEWRRIPELVARRGALAERLQHHPRPLSPGAQQLRSAVAALDDDIAARKLRPGQLVVVDEASLAGTFSLDELVSAAKGAGAKVLLAGDWAQLSAVDAGGAFGLLVRDRAELAPQLTEVRRFHNEWEKVASTELRLGREEAVGYLRGPWPGLRRRTARDARAAVPVVESRRGGGQVEPHDRPRRRHRRRTEPPGAAGPGRRRRGPGGRCGARRRPGGRRRRRGRDPGEQPAPRHGQVLGEERGPLDGHSCQRRWQHGPPASQRQRRGNPACRLCGPPRGAGLRHHCSPGAGLHRADRPRLCLAHHDPGGPLCGRHPGPRGEPALRGHGLRPRPGHLALRAGRAPERDRSPCPASLPEQGADLSAHEVRQRASRQAASWAVLAQEYNTIAQEAQRQRWDEMLAGCGLDERALQAVRGSPAFGPLLASMREAEARGLKVGAVLPKLVHARKFDDATDPAAVLHGRVQRWAAAAASKRRGAADLVAGLLPRAAGVADPDMARALAERDQAMCQRARELAEEAVRSNQPWALQLGPPPTEPVARAHWAEAVTTVAAYRDRWGVTTDDQPLGLQSGAITVEQARQRRLAQAAVERALRLSRQAGGPQAERAVVSGPTTKERGVAI